MAKARDLLNNLGGGGFLPKPASKPLIAKPEDLDDQGKPKVDAKQKLARGKGGGSGGGGGGPGGGGSTVPTGVRPKV